MFGHHDDQSAQQDNSAISDESIQAAAQSVAEGEDKQTNTAVIDTGAAALPEPADEPAAASSDSPADSASGQSWQHPGTPLNNGKEPIKDIISPNGGFPKKPTFQYPVPSISSSDIPSFKPDTTDPAIEELMGIKQKALDDLLPIIDKLDLPPEEKFRTIMMMIQSSDNQALVKAAYAAAHNIEDEAVRAQALLDIVNEVNYFTHPHDDQPTQPDDD
jgi:hypothetical protein